MSARLPAYVVALRRKVLAQPGITPLPVCPRCTKQVQPSEFGREACKPCEAERAAVSAEWDRQRDADVGLNYDRPAPEFPIFGGEDAAEPFLPDEN